MKNYTVGSLVNDRYELKEVSGSGGMASVFKAYDIITKTYVAVKVINEQTLVNPNGLERFEIEKESIANLIESKYVVKLHDVIQKDGAFLLILEYVDGGDFKKFLAAFAPLTTTEIKYYFGDLCKALDLVHRKKIVHRDIKPENVLLTLDKQVKLTDFGISLMDGYKKEEEKTIGTPKYIAPEVIDSQKATPRTDIYSLGIMMYEAATGMAPFRSRSAQKISLEHLYQRPIAPRELNPAIPQALENVILKMIEKDPDSRFQSMQEVLSSLKEVTDQVNIKPYVYKGRFRSLKGGNDSQKAVVAENLNSRRSGVIKKTTITTSIIIGLLLLFAFVGLLLWMI
ncbi:serine/threonine protein kinase [Spiroplasma clarkii]|uniref:Eukaryotic-like serine/threonine-protein kinase n=1 Tax=Spiroplasma clarkii TaxID=2139 RepID=A0A1Y0KZR4_9MOLU|nr:serine/threonine-protein kinase [Spiroplasma clarkii]ARU91221.1 serine/threonine protein kinase [Spiroplasma clarkii]ATX70660.1 eukaryotic-like serine/threonine-protein kinase [Spiroplasma clarkii]